MLGHCWIVQFMIGSLRIPLRKAPIKSQEIRLHHCCLPQPCWWVVSKCSVNICFLTPELNLIWSPPRQPIGNNQASWMRVGSYGRFAFVMDFCLAAKGMGMSSSIQLCTVCLLIENIFAYALQAFGLTIQAWLSAILSKQHVWSDDLHCQTFSGRGLGGWAA